MKELIEKPFSGIGGSLLAIGISTLAGSEISILIIQRLSGMPALVLAGLFGPLTIALTILYTDRVFKLRLLSRIAEPFPILARSTQNVSTDLKGSLRIIMTIRKRFWQIVRPGREALIRATQRPKIGTVSWGDFTSTRPINDNWGFERGMPIDRYYIGQFLERNVGHIRGRVLEVAGNEYTEKYGGDSVEKSDILHPAEGNPRATIIADLAEPSQVTDELFDCVICTQTLQLIFDVKTAITSLYRFLKPGGVLLMTVPGISQICREDMEITGDY